MSGVHSSTINVVCSRRGFFGLDGSRHSSPRDRAPTAYSQRESVDGEARVNDAGAGGTLWRREETARWSARATGGGSRRCDVEDERYSAQPRPSSHETRAGTAGTRTR